MSLPQPLTFVCFNFHYYQGSNPYLNDSALVFDWGILGNPLPIEQYQASIAQFFPDFKHCVLNSYVELFAQTLAWVSRLDADLFCDRVSITSQQSRCKLALSCLHYRTSCGVVSLTEDWLEAITHHRSLDLGDRLLVLQEGFRRSVYGDPTMYALIHKAWQKQIPFRFLWDEGLMQYGYGKRQVRSLSTIFDGDSLLDSDLTTQKDDCKNLLESYGFPVPKGQIVHSFAEALAAVKAIGYPVAVKPVVGHEGIGVTAQVHNDAGLEISYQSALNAITGVDSSIIVEQSIVGSDFRLLAIGGQFVAAMERRPPFVLGDGCRTIQSLITQENATPARKDTPTSPLAKIVIDDALKNCLAQQQLSLASVLPRDRLVYLRKVANISSGGVSVDATPIIHDDNRKLAEDIAQYFRLVALGIDVMAQDLSKSWKEGNFAIIEINAAPGVSMHLNPAIGQSVDVTEKIFEHLFPCPYSCRIPIITGNRLTQQAIALIVEHILAQRPHAKIGAVNSEGVWINHSLKNFQENYNANIERLLRHPQLDLLIAEYREDVFLKNGLIYAGSDLILLDEPTEIEGLLIRDLTPQGKAILKKQQKIAVQTQNSTTFYDDSPLLWSQLLGQAIDNILALIPD